jgi:hypothetical protein
MLFSSLKELSTYYEIYAKQQGFWVVIRNRKNDAHENTHYITQACGRQGSRKVSSSSNDFSKPIQTIKVGCKVNLNAKLVDTKWYVTSVSTDYNHALSSEKARFHKCHKSLDSYAKKKLLLNDDARISMSKNFNLLAIEAGGMRILHLEKKIVVILLLRNNIFILAQEELEHFVIISLKCKQLMMVSTLPWILMMMVD